MMTLNLSDEERDVLGETLESAISELGGEIANTDSYDYREGLKAKKATLSTLLERLRGDGQ